MKRFRNEEGQTLVLTALLGCILMGFMALAIDMGVSFRTQRRVQTQADAAVVAAALCATYGGQFCTQYSTDSSGASVSPSAADATSVATRAAKINGMPSNATISVAAAAYGQHRSGYYEVIIKQPSASPFVGTFAGMFSGGSAAYNPMNVGARAVAGLVPGTTCLYVLNKTADKSLYVKGAAQITAPYCSIQVNSSSQSAICTTGNSADINSGQILVVGSQGSSQNCNQTQSNVQSGGGSANDPLADMKMPDQGCTAGNTFGWGSPASVTVTLTQTGSTITLKNTSTGVTQTVTPSGYSPTGAGGPTVNVACFSDTNVQLTTSLGSDANSAWVFQHGLNVAGGSSFIKITGTTEIQDGNFQEANTNLFISGPTSTEPYTGMALLVPSHGATGPTCPGSISSMGTIPAGDGCLNLQFGSGGSPNQLSNKCSSTSTTPGIVGTVYAPQDVLYMQDNGGCLSVTNIIADELWNKSGDLEIYNYNLAYTTSPLDVVRIVE